MIEGWDAAEVVEHSDVKVWILLHGGSILHGGSLCNLGYFPFQRVVPTGPSKDVVCDVLSVGKGT